MELPVLIEPVAGNGYVAKTGEPLPLRAEGPTPGDALQNLKQLIARRLTNGSQPASVPVPDAEYPWLALAGMYDPNDPEVVAWKRAMADYRERVEAASDYK